MEILELIDRLDNLLYEAKPLPFTENVKVDRSEVFPILDQIRAALPGAITDAEELLAAEPVGEPAAPVDDRIELSRIAATLERLQENQRPAPPPITAAASEQVRGILEGAERAADELRGAARAETDAARVTAEREAGELGERSRAEAEELIARAKQEASTIVAEAERIRAEAQRSARERANAQVDRLQGAAGEVETSAARLQEEFEELLDQLRGPAVALAEVLGGGATKLAARVGTLRERINAVELEAEPPAGDGHASVEADRGQSAGELPGPGDVVVARRLELVDTSEFFAFDEDDDHDEHPREAVADDLDEQQQDRGAFSVAEQDDSWPGGAA